MSTQLLQEKMSFDQLFRISDPKRVLRSATVKGPPVDMQPTQDSLYYIFNFKSSPSTTGLRHKGYIKFLKPKNKNTPLQNMDCVVECGCPDYKYRWAWTNKQRGASRVGPQSISQCFNRAPRKTNPQGKPGLCKHILAAREYIYGRLYDFPPDMPDTAEKLDKITREMHTRWKDHGAHVKAAKFRAAEIAKRSAVRNVIGPDLPPDYQKFYAKYWSEPKPAMPTKAVTPIRNKNVPKSPDNRGTEPRAELDTNVYKNARPPGLPEPLPDEPAEELPYTPAAPAAKKPKTPIAMLGKMAQNAGEPAPALPKPAAPKPAPKPATKAPAKAKPAPAPAKKPARKGKLGDSLNYRAATTLHEAVVNVNDKLNMSSITEARKLISEMEADYENGDLGMDQGGSTLPEPAMPEPGMEDGLEPSEPPISDSAIGADTEGETALGLLRSIDAKLQQLVAVVAPEGAAGELEGPALPGGEGGMPELPPEDIEGEEGAESAFGGEGEGEEGGEEHEASETPEEEEDEEKAKDKKKTEESRKR